MLLAKSLTVDTFIFLPIKEVIDGQKNKSGIYSEICSALLMIVKVMKIFIVYNQLLHVL